MDIQKITDIIEDSQLTDEAKDLINGLLPDAEKPEVQEEIMRIVDYEIKMNDAVTEEGREILKKIEDGNKMMKAVDDLADERVKDLETEANDKFSEIEKEKEEVDEDISKLTGEERAPHIEEPVASTAPAAPVLPWNQSVTQAPVAPTAPAAPVLPWNQTVTNQTGQ